MATQFNDLGLTNNNVNSFVIDETVFTNIGKLKCLIGVTSTSSSLIYCTLKSSESSSGYQVPSGKKFIALAWETYCNAYSSTIFASIYSTSDDVGFLSSTAPTAIGSTSNYALQGGTAAGTQKMFSCFLTFPAGSYISVSLDGGSTNLYYKIYGYEIDADAQTI